MEKYYAFLKDNRVQQVAVFSSQDEKLANLIKEEQGYDNFVFIDENPPDVWSTYDGSVFTKPTDEYLVSIGVLTLLEPEVTDE